MAGNGGFFTGVGSGILGGIAGLAQGLIQRKTDALNAQRNYEMNLKLQNYQYSKDVEMWNRANEYNSPAMQMQRYQSAGLNPNLIYGSGTASAGNTATSLPKYQAPTYRQDYSPMVNLPAVLSMFQDFNIKQAQTDNLRRQGDILFNRNLTERAKGVWNDQELRQMFFATQMDGNRVRWFLKPEMEGIFRDLLVGRWTKGIKQNELMDSQALRNITDNALKEIELMWMKKLGIRGLGGVINAGVNIAKMFR